MAKKVKFPLDMGNEVYVRTLEELKENYNSEKVTEYFLDGRLLTWLNDRYFDDEAEQVQELMEQEDKNNLAAKLGKIFGVEIQDDVDVENLEIRREKLDKLRRITSDDSILENVDSVAFSQEELGDLLDEEKEVIYLCEDKFRIPLGVKNVRYIGVNKPVIDFGSKTESDFEANGITFEGCILPAVSKSKVEEASISYSQIESEPEEIYEDNEEEYNDECYDEQEFTDDKFFKYEVTGNWVKLTKYLAQNSYDSTRGCIIDVNRVIKIPDIVNEISKSVFAHCKAKKIVIPESVEKIGERAFEGCSAEEIVIPQSVTMIGDCAFLNCRNLKQINLPDKMKRFGVSSNSSYYSLSRPSIEESSCISVFQGCNSLESIKIPEGIDRIGPYCFYKCTNLKNVALSNSLTRIDNNAFQGCKSIEEIKIPEGVTAIGDNAFADCTNLKKVYLPDSLGRSEFLPIFIYCEYVFSNCENVVIEYCGKQYKYGQLKSLDIAIKNAKTVKPQARRNF